MKQELKQLLYVELDSLVKSQQIRDTRVLSCPNTSWGELAAYELVTDETPYFPTLDYMPPRFVVEHARAFLEVYPKSKYRFDIHLVLAHALQDLWYCTQHIDYIDEVPEADRQHPDSFRIEAIKHLAWIIHKLTPHAVRLGDSSSCVHSGGQFV